MQDRLCTNYHIICTVLKDVKTSPQLGNDKPFMILFPDIF